MLSIFFVIGFFFFIKSFFFYSGDILTKTYKKGEINTFICINFFLFLFDFSMEQFMRRCGYFSRNCQYQFIDDLCFFFAKKIPLLYLSHEHHVKAPWNIVQTFTGQIEMILIIDISTELIYLNVRMSL